MNKSRQTNGSDGTDKAAAAAPMSQISGVRRLQQSNSIVGVVPRFGVELADEQPLAEVSHRSHSFTICEIYQYTYMWLILFR